MLTGSISKEVWKTKLKWWINIGPLIGSESVSFLNIIWVLLFQWNKKFIINNYKDFFLFIRSL